MRAATRYHPQLGGAVGRSRSPITPFTPRALTRRPASSAPSRDYAALRALAQQAGYDGVEIMGSEGYLINQFIAPRTNHRNDAWGGSFENRMRFPVEIVRRRARGASGRDFIIIFRLSMLDLVRGRQHLGRGGRAGARPWRPPARRSSTPGIGWHEARVPTIADMVPRARVRAG